MRADSSFPFLFRSNTYSPSAVVHSGSFVAACFNSLEPSGILVKQVKAIGHHVMFHTIQYLERAGYPTIVDYIVHDGGTSRLLTRHSSSRFVVAMKNSDSRARWLRNEAEIKLDIARRSHHIPSRESVFQFDGATMTQYQFTSRVVEEAWCAAVVGQPSDDESANNKKWCADGHGYNPDTVTNIPASSLAVRPSRVANGGRGVFTTEFIRQGSALAVEEYVHMIFVPSVTVSLMNQATEYVDTSISKFWAVTNQAYIQGYGFSCWDYVRL
jgi:hypothetical protein